MYRLTIRGEYHEDESWRGVLRFIVCKLVGHRTVYDGSYTYCERCGDTIV